MIGCISRNSIWSGNKGVLEAVIKMLLSLHPRQRNHPRNTPSFPELFQTWPLWEYRALTRSQRDPSAAGRVGNINMGFLERMWSFQQ